MAALFVFLALAAFLPWQGLAALGALQVGAALLVQPAAFGPLRKVRFWLLILLPVVFAALLLGGGSASWQGLRLNAGGTALGLRMALRAFCLVMAFQIALADASTSDMIRLFTRLNLRGLGFALGVAANMLSTLRATSEVVFHTLLLRGGWRRNPLRDLKLYTLGVLAGTLRHGDGIVQAASMRGFDPGPGAKAAKPRGLPPARSDAGDRP